MNNFNITYDILLLESKLDEKLAKMMPYYAKNFRQKFENLKKLEIEADGNKKIALINVTSDLNIKAKSLLDILKTVYPKIGLSNKDYSEYDPATQMINISFEKYNGKVPDMIIIFIAFLHELGHYIMHMLSKDDIELKKIVDAYYAEDGENTRRLKKISEILANDFARVETVKSFISTELVASQLQLVEIIDAFLK